MDDKTEELRDLFLDVADDGEVIEEQAARRGSLTAGEENVEERLETIIRRMRERYDFGTALDGAALRTVVRGFYDGDTDDALANRLDTTAAAVGRARLDLHLVRETDAPDVDLDALRAALAEGQDIRTTAAELGVSVDVARRAREVLEAETEATRASERFRSEFAEVLTDADLSAQHTASMQEDGLGEAAEDIETDVDF